MTSANTYDGQTAKFLATVATCMPKLSGDIMQGWIDNPEALKRVLQGGLTPKGFGIQETKYVVFFTSVGVEALAPFNAEEYYRLSVDDGAGVKIAVMNGMFKEFLERETETSFLDAVLKVWKVNRETDPLKFVTKVGRGKATVTLGQLWTLLKMQGRGQKGLFHVNGFMNHAFVKRGSATFMVWFAWNSADGGWGFYGYPESDCVTFSKGAYVISR